MLRRYRNSIVIAVACVVLGTLYGALAPVLGYKTEWAGVTMLIALGAAMGLLVAVLDSGSGD
jgi:type III secretory pathway component EscT